MALLDFTGAPHGGRHKLLPEWNSQPKIDSDFIVDHSIVGSASGAWFMFRDSTGIESHFILPKNGEIWQCMDTEREADANLQANAAGGISIETEDNGNPNTDPWTSQQLDSLIWLHDKLARVHNIQRRKCPVTNVASSWKGLGYHTLQGAPGAWTPSAGKTCPGKPVRLNQWETILLPAFISGEVPGEDDMPLNDADKQYIHQQFQHFGLLLMANRTGSVFNTTDLADFHFDEWKQLPELRDDILKRVDLAVYRLLKGQNSVYAEGPFPNDEPQENIKDLAARLEALEQAVADLPVSTADELARRAET